MANPATTAAQATQDARIPDLPVLPAGTDPATLTVPVYNPATDKTHQAPLQPNAAVTNSNAVVGGPKLVQYTDSRYYGVPAGALTLDRLDPLTIVPGTLATVDNPSATPLATTEPAQQYVATLVASGAAGAVLVPRYIGAAAGDTVTVIWLESVSGVLLANELIAPRQPYTGLTPRAALIKLLNEGSTSPVTPVTPAAPVVVYNSTTRKLSASHSLGGTLQFSYQGSAFVDYIGSIQVDDAAHSAGDWQFKRLASTGYAESPPATNPAIAAKPVAAGVFVSPLGDSITRGEITSNPVVEGYPNQTKVLLSSTYSFPSPINTYGHSGWKSDQIFNLVADAAQAFLASGLPMWVPVVFAGHNDFLTGTSLAALQATFTAGMQQFTDFAAQHPTLVVRPVVVLPLNSAYQNAQYAAPAAYNADRRAFLDWLLAHATALGIYNLYNPCSTPQLGDPTNTTYRVDGLHPPAAGHLNIAQGLAPVLVATYQGQTVAVAPDHVASGVIPSQPVVLASGSTLAQNSQSGDIYDPTNAAGYTYAFGDMVIDQPDQDAEQVLLSFDVFYDPALPANATVIAGLTRASEVSTTFDTIDFAFGAAASGNRLFFENSAVGTGGGQAAAGSTDHVELRSVKVNAAFQLRYYVNGALASHQPATVIAFPVVPRFNAKLGARVSNVLLHGSYLSAYGSGLHSEAVMLAAQSLVAQQDAQTNDIFDPGVHANYSDVVGIGSKQLGEPVGFVDGDEVPLLSADFYFDPNPPHQYASAVYGLTRASEAASTNYADMDFGRYNGVGGDNGYIENSGTPGGNAGPNPTVIGSTQHTEWRAFLTMGQWFMRQYVNGQLNRQSPAPIVWPLANKYHLGYGGRVRNAMLYGNTLSPL